MLVETTNRPVCRSIQKEPLNFKLVTSTVKTARASPTFAESRLTCGHKTDQWVGFLV